MSQSLSPNLMSSTTASAPAVRRRKRLWAASWATMGAAMAAFMMPSLMSVTAQAQELDANTRSTAIVIDAQSGEVLYARRADSARYPASLTKVMTLYLAFEALASGQIKATDPVVMSRRANSQAPVKIGFRDGDTINVDAAIRLTALYSANDLALGLAEKIGGTEERFAALMTIRAQELGMTQTRFVNANGLPDPRQTSSARDLAILMRAIMRDYPQYYSYLNVRSYEYNGRVYTNHNPLKDLDGVDGGKTGFTQAAGYNLVVSRTKDNHRLIAVMMGSSNKEARRETLTTLLDTGFEVIERREKGEPIQVAQAEINEAMTRHSTVSGPQPYTILASNGGMSEQQLRNTLASSEEANASEDVERLSATVAAPEVARTLAAATPSATAVPLPSLAAPTDQAQPSAMSAAVSTARPYMPAVEKVSMSQMPASPLADSRHAKPDPKASEKAVDDGCAVAPKPASAKGKKAAKPKITKIKAVVSSKSKMKAKLAATKCKAKKDPNAVWAIQVGAFKQKSQANEWATSLKKRFKPQLAKNETAVSKNEYGWYRTRFVELTEAEAKKACKAIDAKRLDCAIIKPEA